MRSFIVLFFSGLVVMVCGQFFGWWNLNLPGMEHIPSYQEKRETAEARRSALRRASGVEDEHGNLTESANNDIERRARALEEARETNEGR